MKKLVFLSWSETTVGAQDSSAITTIVELLTIETKISIEQTKVNSRRRIFDIDSASGTIRVFQSYQLSGCRNNLDESISFRNEMTLRQDEIYDFSLHQYQSVPSYNAIGRFSRLTPNFYRALFASMWCKTARSSTVNPLAESDSVRSAMSKFRNFQLKVAAESTLSFPGK